MKTDIIPQYVVERIKRAADAFADLARAIDKGRSMDRQFGGGGRYEYECAAHVTSLEHYGEMLRQFSEGCLKHGIRVEAYLLEIGFPPIRDFELSPAVQEWLSDELGQGSSDARRLQGNLEVARVFAYGAPTSRISRGGA